MSLIKLRNNALDNLTSFEGSASLGDMVLVSSATASSSASIEFTLGDYKEYKFFFVNIHPSANSANFQVNFSTDNGSNYNVTKTTTSFFAFHQASNGNTIFSYATSSDLAQGTGFFKIMTTMEDDNEGNGAGVFQLFNPSSSTYVKHFVSNCNNHHSNVDNATANWFTGGYANTVSPLTNIKFQMDSGNIDDGKILMFGLN